MSIGGKANRAVVGRVRRALGGGGGRELQAVAVEADARQSMPGDGSHGASACRCVRKALDRV